MMWKNICLYIFSSLLSKIEMSVLLEKNFYIQIIKAKTGSFYGLIRLLFLIILIRLWL